MIIIKYINNSQTTVLSSISFSFSNIFAADKRKPIFKIVYSGKSLFFEILRIDIWLFVQKN